MIEKQRRQNTGNHPDPLAGAMEADAALLWLAQNENLEISHGYEDEDDYGSWRVHSVNGGINDREWTLVARGRTPLEALKVARTKLEGRRHA